MLIHLFDRNITTPEIAAKLAELSMSDSVLLENLFEQAQEDAAAIDGDALGNLLSLLSRRFFAAHIIYRLQEAAAPLLSVFVCGEHMITAAYMRDGIRFSEALNPNDVNPLLLQALSILPNAPREGDAVYTVSGAQFAYDVFNYPDGLSLEPADDSLLEALHSAADEPRIDCILQDRDALPLVWIAVRNGERALTITPAEGQTLQLVAGSLYPLFEGLNRILLDRYRFSLKAVEAYHAEQSEQS